MYLNGIKVKKAKVKDQKVSEMIIENCFLSLVGRVTERN